MVQQSTRLIALAFVMAGSAVFQGCSASDGSSVSSSSQALQNDKDEDEDDNSPGAKTLYVWMGDQARQQPDAVAVINFNEHSKNYGKVLRKVDVGGTNNVGNEAHHCHLSADQNTLICGGLLSVLHGADDYFLFDVKNARHPKYIGSRRASSSHIADDFLPIPGGGWLISNMGSSSGSTPGRIVEMDKNFNITHEWPEQAPLDGSDLSAFNPHGIDGDWNLGIMVTSDLVDPASTLNVVPGNPILRSAVRYWDISNPNARVITQSIFIPTDLGGTMDVKLIPHDPHNRSITASMFTGLVYTMDPTDGSYTQSFDCEDIVPHVETDVPGGMTQLLAMPRSGRRVIFASFQAGQVGMLDITNPTSFTEVNVVDLGLGSGPHDIDLTEDDKRLVVTDYFLNEDDFGKLHFEGDHKVHVLNVADSGLSVASNWHVPDFNTAFSTPRRPHGIAMK